VEVKVYVMFFGHYSETLYFSDPIDEF